MAASNGKPVGVLADELKQLVIEYLKQETIEPAKGLGRSFGFAIAGGFVLGWGFVLLLLGVLRLLQNEVWVFPNPDTGWSWLPYLIAGVVGLIVLGVAAKIAKG